MCRNIKTLYNFDPPATEKEIRLASEQFVRKLSGFNKPSEVNQPAFEKAIDEISHASYHLLSSLSTNSKPKNREEENAKAHVRSTKRFGKI